MDIIYRCAQTTECLGVERSDKDIVYRCANTRKCYWLCRECLKGHSHRCSPKCPGYLSIAKVKKQQRASQL